jgi:hypothetical protein
MENSLPDIRRPDELLLHMQESQAAYLAKREIKKRRVRLIGVPGWYWLVLHLAYPEVGRKAFTVPSASSVSEKIANVPTTGIRMLRFARPCTELLQDQIRENLLALQKNKSDKTKVELMMSTQGYSIQGIGRMPEFAFLFPAETLGGHRIYGLVADGKAVFVLSTKIELDKASATAAQAKSLIDELKKGMANVRFARVFDQESDEDKAEIREYLRSATALPSPA